MRKNKDNVYQVDLKPRWNFVAKFYLVCIVLFTIFVAYICIYRYTHKEQIIENIKNNEKQVVVENTTQKNII